MDVTVSESSADNEGLEMLPWALAGRVGSGIFNDIPTLH